MSYKYIKVLMPLLVGSASATSVFGLDFNLGGIDGIFMTFSSWLQNDYVRAGLTLIFFFVILLGIFTAALRRVPMFKENSKQGKAIATGFSIIGTIGIFFANDRSFYEMVIIVNKYLGAFGGFLIGAVAGLAVYFMFDKDNDNTMLKAGLVLFAAGIAMVIGGSLMP